MHELNLEQGAKTQISRAVELLQISADNEAIIHPGGDGSILKSCQMAALTKITTKCIFTPICFLKSGS